MTPVTFSCFHMQNMESRNSSSQRIIGLNIDNVKTHCISNTVVSFRFKRYGDRKHVCRVVGKLTLDLNIHIAWGAVTGGKEKICWKNQNKQLCLGRAILLLV